MSQQKLPKERFALAGLACVLVFAGTYAIIKGRRQPAPIVFQSLGATSRPPEASAAPKPASVDPSSLGEVVVAAAGAVKHPGMTLHLPTGSRVEDAIKAAGGAAGNADLDSINLAAKLVDGTQVYVPRRGETQPGVAAEYSGGSVAEPYGTQTARESGGHGSEGRAKKEPPAHPVDINTASSEELQQITGIGPATAAKILDYRKEHGTFKSLDELTAIKGISEKKLAAWRKYLRL
ncbi:MAG TPA: helix-hairpin-helix domain-containing protein [Fimbriimonadaceae bacterium]|nr:helix-hairpin-helix domain-containing protein [Fimbriimonadaceae bacterium]